MKSFTAYKNKWFHRWAQREGISDLVLLTAAREISEGKVDASLGGCLFKKRLRRQGGGKSGGYRTIVGYKSGGSARLIFLYGFTKSSKANITTREEAALSLVAESFLSATEWQVAKLIADGLIWEIKHDE